jgi:capsular polysaccharide biosynthesis protein
MAEQVEIFRYIRYLRLRWRFAALSCAIAMVIAAAVTFLTPRQYTATARVLIEPPAGTDLRSAMAISPIYLESLKTYEHFASSDSLFQKALNRFGLHYTQSIESVKKRVLKVALVRNTRILEISATMPDARAAQAMAQFVAESTVELTRNVMSDSDRDLLGGIEQQQRTAQARLQAAEEIWAKTLGSEPVAELQAAMEGSAELRASIQKDVASAELMIADGADRKPKAQAGEAAEIERETSGARARIVEMTRQIERIDRRQSEREHTLAQRSAHRDTLDAERKARQAELVASETRLREARGDAGYRGERMKIIDPGIVPQQPSSPNLLLNVLTALLLGLILPTLYLAIEMNYRQDRISQEDRLSNRRSNLPSYMTRDE